MMMHNLEFQQCNLTKCSWIHNWLQLHIFMCLLTCFYRPTVKCVRERSDVLFDFALAMARGLAKWTIATDEFCKFNNCYDVSAGWIKRLKWVCIVNRCKWKTLNEMWPHQNGIQMHYSTKLVIFYCPHLLSLNLMQKSLKYSASQIVDLVKSE